MSFEKRRENYQKRLDILLNWAVPITLVCFVATFLFLQYFVDYLPEIAKLYVIWAVLGIMLFEDTMSFRINMILCFPLMIWMYLYVRLIKRFYKAPLTRQEVIKDLLRNMK